MTGINYAGVLMELQYESGKPVRRGDVVSNAEDRFWRVTSASAPSHPGSSGRVYTVDDDDSTCGREFFPSVFAMKWVALEEDNA